MIDPALWPRFTNRQMVRFVAIARLSTLLICFILTDPKVHRTPGGFDGAQKKATAEKTAGAEAGATATLLASGGGAGNCLGKAATAGTEPAADGSVEVSSPLTMGDDASPPAKSDPDGSQPPVGFTVGDDSANATTQPDAVPEGENDGLSVPKVEVVGFYEQCAQIWDAMHQDRIWRPMIFICIWALVPGNGDAFNSFTQGCASEDTRDSIRRCLRSKGMCARAEIAYFLVVFSGDCTNPDTGELLPPFGTCERNEAGDQLDPACRDQPNPEWPGGGQYDGADGTRGIEPMAFTSSMMACKLV
jgi:hypothetical protein